MTPLPLALLDQHLAIVGKTGSGKTYAAKGLIERLLDELARRVCIIDPTGVWWGLRALRDGKKPGYSVIVAGGDHGDVPLNERSGAALAGLIANSASPFVVDCSDFGVGERHRFMAEFAEALFRQNRRPLHLIIDEADEFAPQNPLPDTKVMLNRIDRIVRRGRVKGFRVVLITQRPAVLHKNVLTQSNALIAMRLTGPQDRKAVEEWIKGNADFGQARAVLDTLARLGQGEGWVWAPELGILERRSFPPIKTFDSSRAPEHGDAMEAGVTLAPVDLDAVRGALAEAAAEAAANDPKALRARIAELERAKIAPAVDPNVLHAEYRRGKVDGYAAALKAIGAMADQVNNARIALDGVFKELVKAQNYQERIESGRSSTVEPRPSKPETTDSTPAGRSIASTGNAALIKAERLILACLAQYPKGRTKVQIALITGYAHTGGGFNNALSALRSKGFIEGSQEISITRAGRDAIGHIEPLPIGDELIRYWRDRLGKPENLILGYLSDVYPRDAAKDTIAHATRYEASGGGFNNALSRLRTLELITRGAAIKLNPDLFR